MPRAGRWWATRARKQSRRRPCCPSPSGRWTEKQAGSRAARQQPNRPAWAHTGSRDRTRLRRPGLLSLQPCAPASLWSCCKEHSRAHGSCARSAGPSGAYSGVRLIRRTNQPLPCPAVGSDFAHDAVAPGESARGLGKLLVVAPDQKSARLYLDWLRGWMSPAQAEREVRLGHLGRAQRAHE